ncbi:hypothetical protein LINPERHAP2_LOCUS25163 [Linum perenne]
MSVQQGLPTKRSSTDWTNVSRGGKLDHSLWLAGSLLPNLFLRRSRLTPCKRQSCQLVPVKQLISVSEILCGDRQLMPGKFPLLPGIESAFPKNKEVLAYGWLGS